MLILFEKSFYFTFKAFLILLLCILHSCSRTRSCYHYDVYGAEEFVIDSYKIRQGKLAILELEGIEIGELNEEMMEEYQDVIAEDDILKVAVYHPKRRDLMDAIQLINERIGFKISDGKITLPDLYPIEVAGLSLEEAKEKIQACYRKDIQDIEIFLTYKERLARKVELTGAVKTPLIPVDGKIRLYEILALAQVPNGANFFKSYVVRENQQLPIDFYKLVNEGDMSQNIVMKGGDRIFIAQPSDTTVMVMGEVGRPTTVSVPYGFISLREAIVSAGGIPFTGNRNCIQIIRGQIPFPKIYEVAWEELVHLPNDSMLCMPGDTIVIPPKGITEWNRFIEQLLPTLINFQNCYGAYKLVSN